MRTLTSVMLSGLLVVLVGCGGDKKGSPTGPTGDSGKKPEAAADKPKDLIVGVWENVDPKKKGTHEYKADGVLVITMEGPDGKNLAMNGKYKFVEDELVEVELTPPIEGAPKITQKLKLTKISKDEMTQKDEKGEEEKLKKKK